jgi:hypothetical protein
LPFPGRTGAWNAITDVPGVAVGFCTLTDPARNMRFGVTAIVPRRDQGAPRPVCITDTRSVGAVHAGATRRMIDRHADHLSGNLAWAMPVVAETHDGVLNDINAMFAEPRHATGAPDAAKSGPVAEGAVGGGNGMISCEFKAGTGASLRVVRIGGADHAAGALVRANHGLRPWPNILGQPVGKLMPEGILPDVSGPTDHPVSLKPCPATVDELARVHTRAHIAKVHAMSDAGGGDAGVFTPFGRGRHEIAQRAAGGATVAIGAILRGKVENACALTCPPGHHALPDPGMGFCLPASIPVAVQHARAVHGPARVAVEDWDVHHGGGTQARFHEGPQTLTMSLHQDNLFPPDSGGPEERGSGAGEGHDPNIPPPAAAAGPIWMPSAALCCPRWTASAPT